MSGFQIVLFLITYPQTNKTFQVKLIILRIITNEYAYKNIKLNQIHNLIENIIDEYDEEFGFNINRVVKVKCIAELYDKIINETKIIIIDR